jgi:hypothetical protein
MILKIAVFCLFGGLTAAVAHNKATSAYEVPPKIEVATLLPAELLLGPHHRVRAIAQNDGYINHYLIDSDYGIFKCAGLVELKVRVGEIAAIAKLVQVSKSDLFAEGLKRSIEKPIDAVKNIVDRPVESVKAAPKTVGHFFKKVGSSIGNTAKRVGEKIDDAKEDDIGAGEAISQAGKGLGKGAKSVAGFDKAKLDTARQLGVDPYSDNVRLQEEIEKVTWAFFAGGMPLRVVGMVTGAGIVVTATNTIGLPDDIYDVTPSELALRDRTALVNMGADAEVIEMVINGQMLSVSMRHGMIVHLSKLPGDGRVEVLQVAAGLEKPRQAVFLERALRSLEKRHLASPYVNVKSFGRLPAGIRADGIMEVVAPTDYVCWTEQIANFANSEESKGKRRLLISGAMSRIAMEGFKAAGWEVFRLE